MTGQVLTTDADIEAVKSLPDQPTVAGAQRHSNDAAHYTVRERKRRRPSKAKRKRASKANRKRASKAKPKTGGYPTTDFLSHHEWRAAKDDAYAIVNAGYRWTILLTIRPPVHLPDNEKQVLIQRRIGHIGQALKRRGCHSFIYMRTYEKPVGGSLHGHVLIYVPKEHFDVIERYADRFDRVRRKKLPDDISVETHAVLIGGSPDDLRAAIRYPLKEHQRAGPGYEGPGSDRMFYEKGEPITGRRIGFSRDAEAILAAYKARLSTNPDTVAAAVVAPVAPEHRHTSAQEWQHAA